MTFVAEEPNNVPFSVQAIGHSEVMRLSSKGNDVQMRFAPNMKPGMVIGSSASNNTLYFGNTLFMTNQSVAITQNNTMTDTA